MSFPFFSAILPFVIEVFHPGIPLACHAEVELEHEVAVLLHGNDVASAAKLPLFRRQRKPSAI